MSRSTTRRWALRSVLPLSLLLCVACAEKNAVETVPATQVTLRIEAEPQVQAVMYDLSVQLNSYERATKTWEPSEQRVLTLEKINWPVDIVILPQRGDASRIFEVVIEARDADRQVLVQERSITGFAPHDNRLLQIYLNVCRGRLGVTCADTDCTGPNCKVCGVSKCEPVPMMTGDDLPPIDEPDPEPAECKKPEGCSLDCLNTPLSAPKPAEESATLKLQVLDYLTRAPLDDVKIMVCPEGEETCVAPAKGTSFEADTGRMVVKGLAQGFQGRLTLEAEGYLPVDFESLRPIYDTAWEIGPVLMLTPALLEQLKKYQKVNIDTTKGAIATRVFDCDGLPAAGMTVSVTDSAGKVLYLSSDVLPTPGADLTDESGQAVAYDIEDAETTLRIKHGRDVLAQAQVLPTPGRLSYVHVYPQRSAPKD